jgi:tRNA (mo5U34)-methyltransferase
VDTDLLRAEIERLAPWHHAVELPDGLSTSLADRRRRPLDDTRLPELKRIVWPHVDFAGARVLDVACNCGGFSIEAARAGAASVLGIDPVTHYVEQAELLKRALGIEQISYRQMTVEELDPQEIGTFDITLCFGILYHFENPVLAMKRLAAVTERVMVVETALDPDHFDAVWEMKVMEPVGPDDRVASTGLWRTERVVQFYPTETAVEELLAFLGFEVRRLEPPEDVWMPFQDGRRGVFLATRW